MIPVASKQEPDEFDAKVRQPGLTWLKDNSVALDQAPPDPSKLPNYWKHTQKKLWESYDGTCAYLCIFFEWPSGAHSTDHFIAKSKNAGQAYEWSNYRLSCLGMNRNKNKFDDILDPFEIEPNTFVLNLASGKIKPRPDLDDPVKEMAQKTIDRLKLDDKETRKMRARHYEEYCRDEVSADHLKRNSPFVWYEASRQELL